MVVVDRNRAFNGQRLALVVRPGGPGPSQEDREAVLRRWFDGPVSLRFVSEPAGIAAVVVTGAGQKQ